MTLEQGRSAIMGVQSSPLATNLAAFRDTRASQGSGEISFAVPACSHPPLRVVTFTNGRAPCSQSPAQPGCTTLSPRTAGKRAADDLPGSNRDRP